MGEGKHAGYQHFLLFPQIFLLASSTGSWKQMVVGWRIKLLPNDKILNLPKFKAVADDTIIVTQKLKFVLGRIENTMGKGENPGYQQFLLFT